MMLVPLVFAAASASSAVQDTLRFQLENRFEIDVPADAKSVHGWFALPSDKDALQTVESLKWTVDAPAPAHAELKEVRDSDGNRFLFMDARDAAGKKLVLLTTFELTRKEARHPADPAKTRPITEAEYAKLGAFLEPDTNVAITPEMQKIAASVVAGEQNPVTQAR